MNLEQRQAAADPQTKPPDLGCESTCRLLSSTTTIAIYYEFIIIIIIIYLNTISFRFDCSSTAIGPAFDVEWQLQPSPLWHSRSDAHPRISA